MHNKDRKIDILFIDGLNRGYFSLSYIGYLFSLAAELEKCNYNFKILNIITLDDYSLISIINQLKKLNFYAIGMTTNSENIANVYKVCGIIKQYYPTIPIILGGPQVTFSDIKTLEQCDCDIIVRNMGERSFIKIMDCIVGKSSNLQNIKGISFKKNGEIIRNEDDVILDINSLPIPKFEILKEEKYWVIPENLNHKQFNNFLNNITEEYSFFLTGRGCPFSCAFCVEGNIKSKYVFRSFDNVKRDLKHFLSVTKAKYVAFGDDTFTSSPKRVLELCNIIQEVHKEKYYFYWFAEGRVDILSKHPEMIKVMYDAGLRKLQLGIESGRQETLDIYNKKITLEQIERVIIETTKYKDLTIHGNIMMANPKETFSEYLISVDFFERLILLSNFKLDVGLSYLTPFAGTPVLLNHEKFELDMLIENFEFNASAMEHIVCKSKKMSLSEVYALRSLTYTRFMSLVKSKLFNLSKDEILTIYKTLTLSNSGLVVKGILKHLPSFKKYFEIAIAKASVDSENINNYYNYCPLRIWDLEYFEDTGYYFISLDNKKYSLKNTDMQLWELASGKNTIFEIYKSINCNKSLVIELSYILSFYRDLENKLALIFRKY
jgi:radical SAM superfamily enzyme YgiQ (UPF0313 family)